MDEYLKWEQEVYPVLWHQAYDLGKKACLNGLPRECNLSTKDHCYGEDKKILKVYKSAWEQGWDGYKVPEEFKLIEDALGKMPLKPMI